MTDPLLIFASRPSASALYLREDEVRRGIELLYFGHSHLLRAIDDGLAVEGLGRAHHRALYFIARQPDIIISDLIALLGITKQSLSRVIRELDARGLVTLEQGTADRRQKTLRLSARGTELEAKLFAEMRSRMADAYAAAGQASVTGFWHVCEGLIPGDGLRHVTQP